MGYNAIHETVVSDIFETIKDGIRIAGDVVNPKSVRVRNSRSLARATSGLTLAFPVICTNTLPIETASMIAKAIERKNVAMLQMAFSAYNITNAKDAVEHLSKFHQNLNLSKMDLDKFMDAMEMLGESSYMYPEDIRAVAEDCRRNLDFTLPNSISKVSLLEYAEVTKYGEKRIIKEAIKKPERVGGGEYTDDEINQAAYDDSPYNTIGKDNARYYLGRKEKQDQEARQAERDQKNADSRLKQDQRKNDLEYQKFRLRYTLVLVQQFVRSYVDILEEWCKDQMVKLYGSDDISLLEFCRDLDDDQILPYLQDLLGTSKRVTEFGKEFIRRKHM